MTPKVAHFLNRMVLVSIPSLFEDGAARPFKLLDIEAQGLLLQSDEATARLLTNEMQAYAATAPAIFVPFAQIAAVLMPTQAPAAILSVTRTVSAAPQQPAASGASKRRAASSAPKRPAASGAPQQPTASGATKHRAASAAHKQPAPSGAPKRRAASRAPKRRAGSGAPKRKAK
jgi:hypothetical protein